jgi:hypothetical protein
VIGFHPELPIAFSGILTLPTDALLAALRALQAAGNRDAIIAALPDLLRPLVPFERFRRCTACWRCGCGRSKTFRRLLW